MDNVVATADICQHGISSSLCEWCTAKAMAESRRVLLIESRENIERLRTALRSAYEHCLCNRNIVGFDYGEVHKRIGKPGTGKRWLTPRDIIMKELKIPKGDE